MIPTDFKQKPTDDGWKVGRRRMLGVILVTAIGDTLYKFKVPFTPELKKEVAHVLRELASTL